MLSELHARLCAPPPAGALDGANGVAAAPDFAGARAVLHKLKGSALTLGAAAVGACCEAMRQHCIAGDVAAIHQLAGPGSLAALLAATQEVLGTRPADAHRRRAHVGRSCALLGRDASSLRRAAAPLPHALTRRTRADTLNAYTALHARICALPD